MRNFAVSYRPARAVEAKVRNVMLAAGIEAAADLDMKIADRFIEREEPVCQARANFARESPRGGDAELACICAGACDHIKDGAGAGLAQADPHQFAIQIRK